MVEKLFAQRPPERRDRVLDPGCGDGEFIAGVLRACAAHRWQIPQIVGIELDTSRAVSSRRRFESVPEVTIVEADFLQSLDETFDYIIGNPPYVSISGLSLDERATYRARYLTAIGRFDLYVLFFEQALKLLRDNGRLVFITPEKFLYVETAAPLRALLQRFSVEELHFAPSATFADRTTYPLITTIATSREVRPTTVVHRTGQEERVSLRMSSSWQAAVQGFVAPAEPTSQRLADVAIRISCGVATGADGIFVMPTANVPQSLQRFAHPTISGRQILPSGSLTQQSSLLAPYDDAGRLLPEEELGAFGEWLGEAPRRQLLDRRTCAGRKPWYAFHDNFPIADLRRPKLLCKDITQRPFFVVDTAGTIVPRHSVYYIVPAHSEDLEALAQYLNSAVAQTWLRAHCQHAANGFLRMQSHVLKQLPIPSSFRPRTDVVTSEVPPLALLPA